MIKPNANVVAVLGITTSWMSSSWDYTLLVYFCMMFQLGCNVEVQNLIRSVVMQEMLHMSQAANLLIALGGRPIINSRCFAPVYPGPLPGGVMPGLMLPSI